ncbi:ATP-NAD kinase-like domain-containing protein [Blyttiomyces helicus]|uniref:ATP-NAD kinase-like domain-containing protein n=1 Tax=Blyttiomyces helicus TaxID=388810 RepID=A0A4P9WNK2_9FUNG|nr:ATP-NAD kinase-like domain-containing protein [Blyttiomyces helicus]|eukprot:RKO94072.1 ATP-NAD kinase-like domain-containing protein [Blyttiomyces helicus]
MSTEPRLLVVVINPASGLRRAESIWLDTVKPIFNNAGWATDDDEDSKVFISHSQHEMEQFLAALDSERETVVVAIGGDGLVHGLINALQKSPFKSLTLGAIPAGSGNALCTSLGIFTPEDAAHRIVAGQTQPLNISSVHIGDAADAKDDTKVPPVLRYSFCVVSWGLHAQIVRGSEAWRFLGNQRFSLVARFNLVFFHKYRGTLRLKDVHEVSVPQTPPEDSSSTPSTPPTPILTPSAADFTSPTQTFSYFLATKMSSLERGFRIAPHATPHDACLDLILAPDCDRAQTIQMLTGALTSGSHATQESVKLLKVRGMVLVPDAGSCSRRGSWFGFGGKLVSDVCIDGEMIELEAGKALWVRILDEADQKFRVLC